MFAIEDLKCCRLTVVETNLDDMNPELVPHLTQLLLKEGARDVWATPIIMKGGRPAHTLSVLCDSDARSAVIGFLFRETTTFGVRSYEVDRFELERSTLPVETPYGQVEVKFGFAPDGSVVRRSPEFRSCVLAAENSGVPVQTVYQSALTASGLKRPD